MELAILFALFCPACFAFGACLALREYKGYRDSISILDRRAVANETATAESWLRDAQLGLRNKDIGLFDSSIYSAVLSFVRVRKMIQLGSDHFTLNEDDLFIVNEMVTEYLVSYGTSDARFFFELRQIIVTLHLDMDGSWAWRAPKPHMDGLEEKRGDAEVPNGIH